MRAALTALAVALTVTPVVAEDFCPALDVPTVLDLTCREEPDGATVVAPADTAMAAVNRLRVRRLETPVPDPRAWLEEQVTLDTSGLVDTLERWAEHPDNPIKPEALDPGLRALRDALGQLETLTRTGCGEPRERAPGRWTLRCDYDAGIAEGVMVLELRETDGLPVAIDYRAASEQRARQFEALVNGLRLD